MSIKGELNIISDQAFATDRKVEEVFSVAREVENKADKTDITHISSRFRDFVPYYEYNDLVK